MHLAKGCSKERMVLRTPPYLRYLQEQEPDSDTRSTLSKPDRKKFIDAVLCLAKKPQKTPASQGTGVRSRYDDFVLTHIQQSFTIHGTVRFLLESLLI